MKKICRLCKSACINSKLYKKSVKYVVAIEKEVFVIDNT